MNKKGPPVPDRRSIGKCYFYDFAAFIEANYPPASLFAIAEEIAFARAHPVYAGLSRSTDGFLLLIVPIGYGRKAVIELEYDNEGLLQPVMGEIE